MVGPRYLGGRAPRLNYGVSSVVRVLDTGSISLGYMSALGSTLGRIFTSSIANSICRGRKQPIVDVCFSFYPQRLYCELGRLGMTSCGL